MVSQCICIAATKIQGRVLSGQLLELDGGYRGQRLAQRVSQQQGKSESDGKKDSRCCDRMHRDTNSSTLKKKLG